MQLRNIYAKITQMSQSQRSRSSSLLSIDQLTGSTTPAETKKKRKRLSFRALGSSRPVIAPKKLSEPTVIDEEDSKPLTIVAAPNERGGSSIGNDKSTSSDGTLSSTQQSAAKIAIAPKKAAAPPPPPPPTPPVDRK